MGTIFKAIEKSQQTIKNEQNSLDSFEIGTLSSTNGIDPMLVTYFKSISIEADQSQPLQNYIFFPEGYQEKCL